MGGAALFKQIKCTSCGFTISGVDMDDDIIGAWNLTLSIDEFFDRQQAGFERCFEALGITDDRERSWSSLVLAINDSVQKGKTMEEALESIVESHSMYCEHHINVPKHSHKLADIAEDALVLYGKIVND